MSECSICGEEPEQYGDKVCASCFYAPSTVSSKAKTFQSLVKSMSERKAVEVKVPRAHNKVTVFSRQYRNKLCELSTGVYLRFDEDGHALLDAHLVHLLQEFSKHKPGRLRVVPADQAEKQAEEKQAEVEVFVGEEEPDDGVEMEIVVGEEPDDGVEMEIVVGEEPDDALEVSFFDKDPLPFFLKTSTYKNKEDDESSDKNKS